MLSCKSNKGTVRSGNLPYTFAFMDADNIEAVFKHAKETEKLIFLDIYTDWCMPCKMMDENIFSDKKLGEYYNEQFISMKVNAEKGKGIDIANKYRVQAYPTLLFLDSKGKVIVTKMGSASRREMYELAEEALYNT